MPEIRIIPSVIARTQPELDKRINHVRDAAEWLQLDVMDSKFVPNSSLDFDFSLPGTGRHEAHLMVENPIEWIEKNGGKVDTILFHIEPCANPGEIIDLIRGMGKKPGIALNPETSAEAAKPFLGLVQEILVMTVSPGSYGARFLPKTLEKVKELRAAAPKIDIEVDGSIEPGTIRAAFDAGANFFVVGSYLVESKDPARSIAQLKSLLK
jgi:ribulose-phosphate 3-epimerase